MAINITVGGSENFPEDKEENKPYVEPGKPENLRKLNIRKSLDGKIMIFSHQDLDLVIDQKKSKLLIMSTDEKYEDKTYDSQNRLFKFLNKKGLVDPSSIRMGDVYGVLEGTILVPENTAVNRYDVLLLNIADWIENERPGFVEAEYRKKQRVDDLTDPEDEDSTELGKVKHKDTQGSGMGSPGNGTAGYM